MNQDSKNPQAKPPTYPVGAAEPSPTNTSGGAQKLRNADATPGPSPSTGLKSILKIVVPIVSLMAVIFGVTLFSQYTPPSDDGSTGTGADTNAGGEPPLRFYSGVRQWDPTPNASLQDQNFPGFYEPGETVHGASFWFENRNPKSVTMQLKSVSCSACSGGRVAAIPPVVTRQLLQMSAISLLPQGLITGVPLGMAGPAANLDPNRLNWQLFTYRDSPDATYKIPAANNTDGWSPQWGIMDLQFRVMAIGVKPITTEFATQVDETNTVGAARFVITFEGVNAFDVSTPKIEVGELTASSEPRTYDILVYSSTRGPHRNGPGEPGDLTPPKVDVRSVLGVGEPGPFVSVGPPARVPDQDLPVLTDRLSRDLRKPVRIDSAYYFTVNVNPKVGDNRVDIGLLEREIWLAGAGSQAKQIRVKGIVRGPVWLDDNRTDIDLGSYKYREGVNESIRVYTEQRDAVLKVLTDDCRPEFLKVELEKLPAGADHGHYALKLVVLPESRTGAWTNGVIVLELQGPTPQRIRIPIRGAARF